MSSKSPSRPSLRLPAGDDVVELAPFDLGEDALVHSVKESPAITQAPSGAMDRKDN